MGRISPTCGAHFQDGCARRASRNRRCFTMLSYLNRETDRVVVPKLSIPLLVMALLALQVYSPCLDGGWFADDFPFLYEHPREHLFRYFSEANPHGYYRPIEACSLAWSQWLFGETTVPIHLLVLAIHVGLAILVFRVISHTGAKPLKAWLGALYMLLAQTSVYAVTGIDTISQTLGTAAGALSLWWLYLVCAPRIPSSNLAAISGRERNRLWAGSLAAFAVALWSKESSLGFSIMVAVVLVAVVGRSQLRRLLKYALPYATVTAAYLGVWFAVASERLVAGKGRGTMQLGSNLVRNAAQFIAATTSPLSTLDVFVALKERNLWLVALALVLIAGVVALAAVGLWRSEQRRWGGIMLMLAVLGCFPAVIMNHVNELHAYNLLPFVAVMLGLGLGEHLERHWQRPAFALCAALLLQHALLAHSKTTLVADNGAQAQVLLAQLLPFASDLPSRGVLVLHNPAPRKRSYSVFRVNGFDVLSPHVERVLRMRAGRPDIDVVLRQSTQATTVEGRPRQVLTLRGQAQIDALERYAERAVTLEERARL